MANYFDRYGFDEGPPAAIPPRGPQAQAKNHFLRTYGFDEDPPAPPPAPEPGLGERALGAAKDVAVGTAKGLGGSYSRLAASLNTLAGAAPVAFDAARSVLEGRPITAAQDAWFREMVDPLLERQQAFAPGEGLAAKAGSTVGEVLGMLSQMVLTGGRGAPAPGPTATTGQVVGEAVETGFKSMAVPGLSEAVNVGREVLQETGDEAAAVRAAQAQYLVTSANAVLPLSAPGGAMTRVLGGAAAGAAGSEASRVVMNEALPDSLRRGFDPQQFAVDTLAGAAMGGALGPRAAGPAAPREATSPVAAIEAAQAEAADAAAARGGDLLDQAVEAAIVGADGYENAAQMARRQMADETVAAERAYVGGVAERIQGLRQRRQAEEATALDERLGGAESAPQAMRAELPAEEASGLPPPPRPTESPAFAQAEAARAAERQRQEAEAFGQRELQRTALQTPEEAAPRPTLADVAPPALTGLAARRGAQRPAAEPPRAPEARPAPPVEPPARPLALPAPRQTGVVEVGRDGAARPQTEAMAEETRSQQAGLPPGTRSGLAVRRAARAVEVARPPVRETTRMLTEGEGSEATKIPRRAELQGRDAKIQGRFARQIEADVPAAVRQYRALPETRDGQVVSADIAKELNPAYLRGRDVANEGSSRPAGWLADQVYREKLREAPREGEAARVVFTGGGTGSGKTSHLNRALAGAAERPQIVYDSTFSNLADATRHVDQALAAGKKVDIVFTYREPIDAFRRGVLKRAAEQERQFGTGRPVRPDQHAGTHTRAVATLKAVAERYRGSPDVAIRVLDNTSNDLTRPLTRTVESLPDADPEAITRGALNELDAAYRTGEVSDRTYRAVAGREPGLERPVRTPDRGRDLGDAPARVGLRARRDAAQAERLSEREARLEKRERRLRFAGQNQLTTDSTAARPAPSAPEAGAPAAEGAARPLDEMRSEARRLAAEPQSPDRDARLERLYGEIGRATIALSKQAQPAAATEAPVRSTRYPDLAKAYTRLEGGDTPRDLLNTVEALLDGSRAPKSLRAAADRFRQAMREDYEEHAGRGDVEPAEQAFVRAVERVLGGRPRAADGWTQAEPGTDQRRLTVEETRKALQPVLDETGMRDVRIVDRPEDLPPAQLDVVRAEGQLGSRGFYDPVTGEVTIFAGNHQTPEMAVRTAVHEIVAHKGLRALLGEKFDATMGDIFKTVKNRRWVADYAERHALDLTNPADQQLVGDEYAAHLAETMSDPPLLQRIIDAVRAGLRRVKLVREWTDDDIRRLLRTAKTALRERAGLPRETGLRFASKDDGPIVKSEFDADHPLAVHYKFGATVETQANYNRGVVGRAADAIGDMAQNSIEAALGLIPRDRLVDFMAPGKMDAMRDYIREARRMDGRRNELFTPADEMGREWLQYASKNKEAARTLGELMHASTLAGVDPSQPYTPRFSSPKNPEQALIEDQRRAQWRSLQRFWRGLDGQAQSIFNRVRDMYSEHRSLIEKALEQRVLQSQADGKVKQELINELRQKFEAGRVAGPYFPLARFGDYWAVAKDAEGTVLSFSRFERPSEQRAWLAEMRRQGLYVDSGKKMDNLLVSRRVDPAFVSKVTDILQDVDRDLADEVWQQYLRTMPEMSMRKHFIHRKGRLGFTADAVRAFAHTTFHGAHQLARLEHMDRMQQQLDQMRLQAREIEMTGTDVDRKWAAPLVKEMELRHEWARNPSNSPLASTLTAVGFAWYLGATPAAALVNLTQTPIVAFPVVAGKHGWTGAGRELTRAMAQWAGSRGPLENRLRGDERRAFDEAKRIGLFSQTNTASLAGTAEAGASPWHSFNRGMEIVGWMFQKMEEANREITFLAAYRLGRKQGKSHDDAVLHGEDLVWDSHFDYCVDTETQCLTTTGWKRYDEIRAGDVAVGVDASGAAVLTPVEHVNVFNGDKEVVEVTQRRRLFSMAVTPNHECLVRSYNSRQRKWGAVRRVKAARLKQSHHLVRAPVSALASPSTGIGVDMAALLGWIAAEGQYAKFRNCTARSDVRLAQSETHNPEYVAEIDALLRRLDPETKRYCYRGDRMVTWVLARALRKRVLELLPDKKLSYELVFSMSTEERRALIDAFCKGDGHQQGRTWIVGQAAQNDQNLEVLLAACTLEGRQATLGGWLDRYVTISSAETGTHMASVDRSVKRVDTVWCPTTGTGTWIARRGGSVFVTGNSNTNRARVVQGDAAKVLLLFRQYALHMTYRLARDFRETARIKDADPAVRAEAARRFTGIVGMTGLFAGVTGMPLYWAVERIMNAVLGDEDRPYDFTTEMRAHVAQTYGESVADAIFKGPVDGITGASISSRVGLNNLWWRDPPAGTVGADAAQFYAAQALGPIFGIPANMAAGALLDDKGFGDRAVERFVPKAAADVLKAARYAREGVTDIRGQTILTPDEISKQDLFLQAMGFAPAAITKTLDQNQAIKSAEQKIVRRRQNLLDRLFLAAYSDDTQGVTEAMAGIVQFNERVPEMAIDASNIINGARARNQFTSESVNGVRVAPGLRYLYEKYNFTPESRAE